MPPKWVPKLPILVPNRSKWTRNGYKMAKMGPKMTTVGPKWPIRGSNTILGGPGPRKRVLRAKKSSKMEVKMVQKSIKKPFKKTVVFRSGFGRDFRLCFTHFHPKMVPKWSEVGTKIDTKTASGRKSGFSFSYSKTKGLRGVSGVRGFHFRDPKRSQIDEKTMSEADSGFRLIFSAFGLFWDPFWSQKPDSGASFSRPFWGTEKQALKPWPRVTEGTKWWSHMVP